MNMTNDMIRTDILGMPNVPQINAPYSTSRKGGFELSVNWQDRIDEVGYRLGVNYSYWDQRVTRHTNQSADWWSPTFDNIGERWMHPVYRYALATDGLYGDWNDMYNSMLNAPRNMALGSVALVDLNGDGRVNDYYDERTGHHTAHSIWCYLGRGLERIRRRTLLPGATHVSGAMPSHCGVSKALCGTTDSTLSKMRILPVTRT